jgi:hypothetical protein
MYPGSMMMIHDASIGVWGRASDLREVADLVDKISDNSAELYAAKAGGTAAEWRERMLAETWYTASEAVEAGLADRVEEPVASDTINDAEPPAVDPTAPAPQERAGVAPRSAAELLAAAQAANITPRSGGDADNGDPKHRVDLMSMRLALVTA